MNRNEKQVLCGCGHKRAAHSGKGYTESCGAPSEFKQFDFCKCKRFQEGKFQNEEEIEMAKKESSKKRVAGERKPRTRRVYGFDVEAARKLRDEKYSSDAKKDSTVGLMLRALITANREGYTAAEIFELANKNDAKLTDVNVLPIGSLVAHKALQLTTKTKQEARSAASAKATKKARKPHKSKHNGASHTSSHESHFSETAREGQAEAAPF